MWVLDSEAYRITFGSSNDAKNPTHNWSTQKVDACAKTKRLLQNRTETALSQTAQVDQGRRLLASVYVIPFQPFSGCRWLTKAVNLWGLMGNVSYRLVYWLMVSSVGAAACEAIETGGIEVAGGDISPGWEFESLASSLLAVYPLLPGYGWRRDLSLPTPGICTQAMLPLPL